MLWFFSWYLTITLLGWLTFPLVFRLFPALADRGYSLSRAVGLLVWGYVFWLLTSLGLSQNDAGGLLLGLLILAGLSIWALRSVDRRQQTSNIESRRRTFVNFWLGKTQSSTGSQYRNPVLPGLCLPGLCARQQSRN